jgi:phage FluMu gp28-like protein
VTVLDSDQYMGDALRDLAFQVGLVLVPHHWTNAERTKRYMTMRTMFEIGEIELPPDPLVRQDLQRVVKRYTQSGISIDLTRTNDGRHADYAPAICMALTRWHEESMSRQQQAFEGDYKAMPEEERKIWDSLEKKLRRKNDRASRFRP